MSETQTDRKPIFVECKTCGERWKFAMVPIEVSKMVKQIDALCCPNCGETSRNIYLCHTDGPHAMTAPRDGKPVEV